MKASEHVARKIKEARKRAGMSVDALAEAMDSPREFIVSSERRYTSTMDRLASIHGALGLPLWELLPTREELQGGGSPIPPGFVEWKETEEWTPEGFVEWRKGR